MIISIRLATQNHGLGLMLNNQTNRDKTTTFTTASPTANNHVSVANYQLESLIPSLDHTSDNEQQLHPVCLYVGTSMSKQIVNQWRHDISCQHVQI